MNKEMIEIFLNIALQERSNIQDIKKASIH